MHDPTIRFALLYGIGGTAAIAGSIFLIWHLRRAYWMKLRQAGDARAKKRELQRKRR